MIRMRKECPEISWGDFTVLRTNVPEVLALRYDWRETSLLTLHNFADRAQTVQLKVGCGQRRRARRRLRRPPQPAPQRRHTSHQAGAVRLALVPCRRRRQHA